jgi:uncharacterized protein
MSSLAEVRRSIDTLCRKSRLDYVVCMSKHVVIELLRTQEAELRGLGVDSLSVFGSVARDEDRKDSDIDVAVRFDPARIPGGLAYFGFLDRLQERLRETLGRRVDLVAEPATRVALQQEIDRDRIVAF